MMFELYGVPSLSYGIDFQFSLLKNLPSISSNPTKDLNALIISSSYQTTHIVPMLNGRINYDKSRRISIGGFHVLDLLTKSMHLRYPDLKNKFTNEVVQEIQHNHLMTAKNYRLQLKSLEHVFNKEQEKIKEEEKIRMFGSMKMYQSAMEEPVDSINSKYKHLVPYRNIIEYNNRFNEDNDNIVDKLVFFEWPKNPNEVILTEEDIKKKQELRKEQSKRLREIMQKKKEENIKNLEKELKELENICMLKDSSDKYQFEV
jgi:actin-related protein